MADQEKMVKTEDANADKHTESLKKLFKNHKIDETTHKDFFEALMDWRKKIWVNI